MHNKAINVIFLVYRSLENDMWPIWSFPRDNVNDVRYPDHIFPPILGHISQKNTDILTLQ